MGSFTKTECFQEQNCLFFKSLEGFYSLQPAPLDTLEKPDLKVFTKMKSFSFLKYSSKWQGVMPNNTLRLRFPRCGYVPGCSEGRT